MPRPILTLYTRSDCHLCGEMRAAIEAFEARYEFELREVDVDDDEALAARYGNKVPCLTREGREICHYFFDEPAFRRCFDGSSG